MDFSRRTLFGTAAAAASLGLASAHAAEPGQPDVNRGAVQGDKVVMVPLQNGPGSEVAMPNPDPIQQRLGVAVVGLGHLSLQQILPAFGETKHVRLMGLVSGDREKARVLAAQYGVPERGIYDYSGFDAVKNNADIDIIYIVLPNAMHAEYTVRAAAAGKHVLCEKPMATNVADAQRMIDACRQAARKLMIAYRCQYLPQHRDLIAMTRRQEFGKLQLITAVNGQNDRGNGQWRQNRAMAGGGSLPDVGIYCLNAARYLTGEEPVEITARLTQPKDDPRFREIEDIVAFTLLFPSGVLANLACGYSFAESRSLWLHAENARFGLDPAFSYDNLTMQIGRKLGHASALEQRRYTPHNQFALEMDAFAQAIRSDSQPLTPGEEGLQDLKLIDAIYQAAKGGGVIRLPEIAKLDSTRGPVPKFD